MISWSTSVIPSHFWWGFIHWYVLVTIAQKYTLLRYHASYSTYICMMQGKQSQNPVKKTLVWTSPIAVAQCIIMMNVIMNQFSFLWYSHYDVGRNTGITVSKHNSRVGGYNIGVVKGKEIAQEVCFISLNLTLLVKLVLIQPQLILLTTMAESISQ